MGFEYICVYVGGGGGASALPRGARLGLVQAETRSGDRWYCTMKTQHTHLRPIHLYNATTLVM